MGGKENANHIKIWSNEQKASKESIMELLSRFKENIYNMQRVIERVKLIVTC